jgi:hypothetical protein
MLGNNFVVWGETESTWTRMEFLVGGKSKYSDMRSENISGKEWKFQ